jgi:hypothetical protein
MVPDEATRLSARSPTAMPRSAMFGVVAISPTVSRVVVTSFDVMLNVAVYLTAGRRRQSFLWSSYPDRVMLVSCAY